MGVAVHDPTVSRGSILFVPDLVGPIASQLSDFSPQGWQVAHQNGLTCDLGLDLERHDLKSDFAVEPVCFLHLVGFVLVVHRVTPVVIPWNQLLDPVELRSDFHDPILSQGKIAQDPNGIVALDPLVPSRDEILVHESNRFIPPVHEGRRHDRRD